MYESIIAYFVGKCKSATHSLWYAVCVKKNTKKTTQFLDRLTMRARGLEPPPVQYRLEPESSASANSAMPAYFLCRFGSSPDDCYSIHHLSGFVKGFCKSFLKKLQKIAAHATNKHVAYKIGRFSSAVRRKAASENLPVSCCVDQLRLNASIDIHCLIAFFFVTTKYKTTASAKEIRSENCCVQTRPSMPMP